MKHWIVLASFFIFLNQAWAAPRDVQIRSVDFETGVVELFNTSTNSESLTGWQFCTQDDDETLRYSTAAGLNGVTIPGRESFFIHWNNDAPVASNRINRTTIGGDFALPLDRGPYAMALYFTTPFNDGNNMADFVQWNIAGADDTNADERSDEAEDGGVWSDQNEWVYTRTFCSRIFLGDLTGQEEHNHMDYTTTNIDQLGWWRFLEGGGTNLYDATAHVGPLLILGPFFPPPGQMEWEDDSYGMIYDQDHDLNNHGSLRRPITVEHKLRTNSVIMTNWTLEVVHQFNAGGENTTFFEIDEGNGVGTTNSAILLSWPAVGTQSFIRVFLRDAEDGSASHPFFDVAKLNADGAWHHIAIAKDNANLRAYVDYAQVTNFPLSPTANGTYHFTTNHNVKIGASLNGAGGSKTPNVFDEIRFTTRRLTGPDFISSSRPIFYPVPPFNSPQEAFNMSTIVGKNYAIMYATDLTDTNTFSEIVTFNALSELQFLFFPTSVRTNNPDFFWGVRN